MENINEFLHKLVSVLRMRDLAKIDDFVKSCETRKDVEIYYYLWLLFHPEGIPYIDDNLSDIYEKIADIEKAERYGELCFNGYNKLCEQGETGFMSRLGELYLEGCGCEVDNVMAEYWFRKASN
jgi:TPR repeat protein